MIRYTIRHHEALDGKTRVFMTDCNRSFVMGDHNLQKYIKQRIDEHQSEIEYWERLNKLNEKASQGVDRD
jgi:hypothetical protein